MKFIIANLLVAFCFIGYVEAQATRSPLWERAEPRIMPLSKTTVVNKPAGTPSNPTPSRSNPNNSLAINIRRKDEENIPESFTAFLPPGYIMELIEKYPNLSIEELYRKAEREIDLKTGLKYIPELQDPIAKKEVKKQKQPSPKAIAPKQNYRYSFSGADCNVFARVRSTSTMIHLDSVSTVSVSIYEAKAPVRRLGHASPVGFTGNIRTVAGSIICVLRDNHPLSEMMEGNFHTKHLDDNQIRDNGKGNFNSGALFPFDLMLMYKNEVGDALGFSIYNVEIISEGIVTSTNDMITEVVLQFQATHIDQIEKKS